MCVSATLQNLSMDVSQAAAQWWGVGVNLGASLFVGLIALGILKRNPDLTVGLPKTLGVIATSYDEKNVRSGRAMYYHLRIVNKSGVSANNCKVILRGMRKKDASGNFFDLDLPVYYQFKWAPLETHDNVKTVVDEDVIDFICTSESSNGIIKPCIIAASSHFQGNLYPGDTIQYDLKIIADGYNKGKIHTVEVEHRGSAGSTLEEIREQITIKVSGQGERNLTLCDRLKSLCDRLKSLRSSQRS